MRAELTNLRKRRKNSQIRQGQSVNPVLYIAGTHPPLPTLRQARPTAPAPLPPLPHSTDPATASRQRFVTLLRQAGVRPAGLEVTTTAVVAVLVRGTSKEQLTYRSTVHPSTWAEPLSLIRN